MSIEKKSHQLFELDSKISDNINQQRSLEFEFSCLQDENFCFYDDRIKEISEDIMYTLKWLDDNFKYVLENPEYIRNILFDLNPNIQDIENNNLSQYQKDSFLMFFEYLIEKLQSNLNEEDILKIHNIILESLNKEFSQELQKKLYNIKPMISSKKGSITKLRNNREKKFKEGELLKSTIKEQSSYLEEFLNKKDSVYKLGKRKEHTADLALRKNSNTKLKVLQEAFTPFWYYFKYKNPQKEENSEGVNYFVIDPSRLSDELLISLNLVGEEIKDLNEYEKLEKKSSLISEVRYILKNAKQLETYPMPRNYTSRILVENTEYAKGKIILFQTISGRYSKKYPNYQKTVTVFDDVYSFLRSQNHTLYRLTQKKQKLIEIKNYLTQSIDLLHNIENEREARSFLLAAYKLLSESETFFEKKAKKDRLDKVLSKSHLKGYDINIIKAAVGDIENSIVEKEGQYSQISYQSKIVEHKKTEEKSIWKSYYNSFLIFLELSKNPYKENFFKNIIVPYSQFKDKSKIYLKKEANLYPFVNYQENISNSLNDLSKSMKDKDLENVINKIGKLEFNLKLQRFKLFIDELKDFISEGYDVVLSNVDKIKVWVNDINKDLHLQSINLLNYGGVESDFYEYQKNFEIIESLLENLYLSLSKNDIDSISLSIGKIIDYDINFNK